MACVVTMQELKQWLVHLQALWLFWDRFFRVRTCNTATQNACGDLGQALCPIPRSKHKNHSRAVKLLKWTYIPSLALVMPIGDSIKSVYGSDIYMYKGFMCRRAQIYGWNLFFCGKTAFEKTVQRFSSVVPAGATYTLLYLNQFLWKPQRLSGHVALLTDSQAVYTARFRRHVIRSSKISWELRSIYNKKEPPSK